MSFLKVDMFVFSGENWPSGPPLPNRAHAAGARAVRNWQFRIAGKEAGQAPLGSYY